MPILLLILLAAIGVGIHERYSDCESGCPYTQRAPAPTDAPPIQPVVTPDDGADDDAAEAAWLGECQERFQAAARSFEQAANPGGDPESGTTVTQVTAEGGEAVSVVGHPGGSGVLFRIESADGRRLVAGVSARQDGEINDRDWYDLNGTGAHEPNFSFFRDQDGRSAFIAGTEVDAGRRVEFLRAFVAAADECLQRAEPAFEDPETEARP